MSLILSSGPPLSELIDQLNGFVEQWNERVQFMVDTLELTEQQGQLNRLPPGCVTVNLLKDYRQWPPKLLKALGRYHMPIDPRELRDVCSQVKDSEIAKGMRAGALKAIRWWEENKKNNPYDTPLEPTLGRVMILQFAHVLASLGSL